MGPDDAEDYFDDDSGSAHEVAINALAAADIADGCRPGSFCPDEPMTRAQAATMLARALPGPTPSDRDHFSDDDGSIHEIAINALAEKGILDGCGPGSFCPDDPLTRAQTATLLARALDLPVESQPIPWRLELVANNIIGGVTDLQAPPGDDRLFLTTQQGRILIIADDAVLPEPFLDLTHKVLVDDMERGLLGLAFHPDYDTNNKFYVFYTDLDGHSQVYEYQTSSDDPDRADPSTAKHIITFEQDPTHLVHKGGQLQFGVDGYLWIAVGDGRFDLQSQNLRTLLGTIIRIDIDNGDPYTIPADNPYADGRGGLPEIWAYGLRNPWRFSFDGPHIYIADVGHTNREEINIADSSQGGINYGWPIMQGTRCHDSTSNCEGMLPPKIEYDHDRGLAVIGGYVYRGAAIPEMTGRYFYSDYTGAWIRTFEYNNGEVTKHRHSTVTNLYRIYSFGKDGHGELYVLAHDDVFKIVPR